MEGETAGELDKATEQGTQGLGEAGAEGGREGGIGGARLDRVTGDRVRCSRLRVVGSGGERV